MSDHCCEDEKGNALCRELIGVFCTAVRGSDGYVKNFEVTKDGIKILRHVGCPKFRERESRVGNAKKESCEVCLLFDGCDFKNDMVGKQCPKFRVNKGVLGESNWT